MKGIRIIAVGRIKEDYFKKGIAAYEKQIREQCPFEIIELIDEPTPDKASALEEKRIIDKEGERILRHIAEDDHVIALCIEGKASDTDHFAKKINRLRQSVTGSLVFVIGGSLGLSPAVKSRAKDRISFSSMTFPHQMMRLILCEQISRALHG